MIGYKACIKKNCKGGLGWVVTPAPKGFNVKHHIDIISLNWFKNAMIQQFVHQQILLIFILFQFLQNGFHLFL